MTQRPEWQELLPQATLGPTSRWQENNPNPAKPQVIALQYFARSQMEAAGIEPAVILMQVASSIVVA
jgi:hypothetical protein